MPNLPTITVTDAQASRILAVFGDVAAYKNWLTEQVRAHVVALELLTFEDSQREALRVKRQEIDGALPAPVAPPAPPPA